MDNNELDSLLNDKFQALSVPPATPSVVPGVMDKIAAVEAQRAVSVRPVKSYDWLLIVAGCLGAAVGLSFIQPADISSLLEQFSPASYSHMAGQPMSWLLAFVFLMCIGPLVGLLVED